MEQSTIRQVVLRKLYDARMNGNWSMNLHQVCEEHGWEVTMFWKIVDRMGDDGIVKPVALGGEYAISFFGMHYAEENNIVDEQVKRLNNSIRMRVLEKLADAYEQFDAGNNEIHFEQMAKEFESDTQIVSTNLDWLEDFMYVKHMYSGYYRITNEGLKAVEEHRRHAGLLLEFKKVEEMLPQARGRAFQKLFARVCERDGWSQEEGVRTSNEEMDVMIHRGREYFMVECKWEKDPVDAPVVREFYGKLNKRIAVQGIIVSMAGFTSGAVKEAEDLLHDKVILFFGPSDVRILLEGMASFDDLLNSKYQKIVTRKVVVFE